MSNTNQEDAAKSPGETLHEAESPVSRAIVAICEKCGKKIATQANLGPDVNPSRDLQKHLKVDFANAFGRGVVRPVTSSCLDVCPDGEITVGIFRTDETRPSHEFFTFEMKNMGDEATKIAEALKKKLET